MTMNENQGEAVCAALFRRLDDTARLLPFVDLVAQMNVKAGEAKQRLFLMTLLKAKTTSVGDIASLEWSDLPLIITRGEFDHTDTALQSVKETGPYNSVQV